MFKILFLAIYTTLIFAHLYRLVKTHIRFSKRQKMIDEYHEFKETRYRIATKQDLRELKLEELFNG